MEISYEKSSSTWTFSQWSYLSRIRSFIRSVGNSSNYVLHPTLIQGHIVRRKTDNFLDWSDTANQYLIFQLSSLLYGLALIASMPVVVVNAMQQASQLSTISSHQLKSVEWTCSNQIRHCAFWFYIEFDVFKQNEKFFIFCNSEEYFESDPILTLLNSY